MMTGTNIQRLTVAVSDMADPARATKALNRIFDQLARQMQAVAAPRQVIEYKFTTTSVSPFPLNLPQFPFTVKGIALVNAFIDGAPTSIGSIAWSRQSEGVYQIDNISGLATDSEHVLTLEVLGG